ncbi:MAG: NAD-dependent epimerase/dehydratase family protein [Acetobacteraceae bacterium]
MSKTYLLTGGAGFIGRHLSNELLAHGHHVRVLDNLLEQVHGPSPLGLPPEIELIRGDIRDPEAVSAALHGVDGVFHLAAEVGVGQSMYEIARYVGVNDLGTAVLMEQLIARPVERLVIASSMSVYGEGRYVTPDGRPAAGRRSNGRNDLGWDPLLDDVTPLKPVPTDETKEPDLASIYALTKYTQERSCLIVAAAYGFQAVALRLFNVFGPGQALSNPYTGVLANFGSRLLNGQRPLVFEDGQQRRDFVHVRDVATAFRLAMETPGVAGEVFNIGSGHSYTVEAVARMLAKAMRRDRLAPDIMGKARSGDIRHCFADITKARQRLGYRPAHRLEDTLDELAEWISRSTAADRGDHAKRELEQHGLVA